MDQSFSVLDDVQGEAQVHSSDVDLDGWNYNTNYRYHLTLLELQVNGYHQDPTLQSYE